MDYHPVTAQLAQHEMRHETYTHEPVRTSEQAARIRPEYTLQQGAKAILLRVKKSEREKFFVMLVFPADKQFDKSKVKKYLGARDVRFATEQQVLEITGEVEPGGVPPFGNLFGLRVIVDPGLFENEKIIFNAGDRSFSVAMLSHDYQQLVNSEIVSITSEQ